MRESTVKLMLRLLSSHFKEPVKPVSKYCESLRTWARIIEEKVEAAPPGSHPFGRDYADRLRHVLRDISKSNLLARLIYGDEKLREKPCPVHKGKWSGIGECPEGCDETGWLPEPVEPARAPGEVSLLDIVEVNAIVVPKDMRRWLESHGWRGKPSTSPKVELWTKLVRNAEVTEEVMFGLPFADDTPNFARWVEDAIYLISEKFGSRPSHLLIEINSVTGSESPRPSGS